MDKMEISFDPSDESGMHSLMDQYGDSSSMFLGVNEEMEDISISIFKEKIVTVTYQKNGWTRKNVYHRDGVREELYEGKWNAPESRRPRRPISRDAR